MKKHLLDLRVTESQQIGSNHVLLRLSPLEGLLPEMRPGQFAQLRIDGAREVLLRRPVSIHNADWEKNEVSFLIQVVGKGTQWLSRLQRGDTLNAIMPLGNGFSLSEVKGDKTLLVGGGVGVAPLYFLGKEMLRRGQRPTFLIGARDSMSLLRIESFQAIGTVHVCTEDGSMGTKGFVTQHPIWQEEAFTLIQTCGPLPMMKAIAQYAHAHHIKCEVSLENNMACGIGACLCCVTKTKSGHKCVCTEGPVFDASELAGMGCQEETSETK